MITQDDQSLYWLMVLTYVVTTSSQTILINLAKVNGKIQFSSLSVVLKSEALKLTFSVIMFVYRHLTTSKPVVYPSKRVLILYSVPSILYMINNNLITHSQNYMDPASWQILGNLKIVATAVMYKLVINRHITRRKSIGVFLLFLAGVVNSLGALKADGDEVHFDEVFITHTGVGIVLVYCIFSGVAGVYTEAILKKYKTMSIHVQNFVMYSFGIAINGFGSVVFRSLGKDGDASGFFDGFNKWTWCVILLSAVTGLVVSFFLKVASNITRLVLIGVSTLGTSILSYIVFGYQLTLSFHVSFVITLLSLYFMYEPPTDVTVNEPALNLPRYRSQSQRRL